MIEEWGYLNVVDDSKVSLTSRMKGKMDGHDVDMIDTSEFKIRHNPSFIVTDEETGNQSTVTIEGYVLVWEDEGSEMPSMKFSNGKAIEIGCSVKDDKIYSIDEEYEMTPNFNLKISDIFE